MNVMASNITGHCTVWSHVCCSSHQSKYQCSPLLVLYEGNPPLTSGFPSQRASDPETVSMSWHYHRLPLHIICHCSQSTCAHYQRSITPKFVTLTALSCIDNSWRSTTLSPPKKLTSSTANLDWCHVHFIRDLYSTFIPWVIGQSKISMESFFNAKFDFKSTWNRDSTTSHHKHPVCQSPTGDAEKLTNVWSRYFETNRIIDNWHQCLGIMWRKWKNYFDK